MKANEFITETWSQKYKKSINCSHPKGFSQKAHCAGKKKHNESVDMEMVCEDCGMCQTHGSLTEIAKGAKDSNGFTKCWPGKHAEGTKKGKNGGQVRNCVPNESVSEDWNKVNHHDKTSGLSQKAVNAYRREHPGSKLQTAVTTKPSKLKAGSKDAKRRNSFCARMSGNKGPMKTPTGKPTPKALALRRWHCESIEDMRQLIENAEHYITESKSRSMDASKVGQVVPELHAALLANKTKIQKVKADKKKVYKIIDGIMTSIALAHNVSGQKVHDLWVKKYKEIPDTWIMNK